MRAMLPWPCNVLKTECHRTVKHALRRISNKLYPWTRIVASRRAGIVCIVSIQEDPREGLPNVPGHQSEMTRTRGMLRGRFFDAEAFNKQRGGAAVTALRGFNGEDVEHER